MNVETIVVEANGKFGPKVDGKYYSFSKFYKGEKELVIGQPISVDVFTSESGKKYINAVLPAGETAPKIVAPAFNKTPTVKPLAKSDGMSKEEWAAKDVRISRQGVIQAAVQAVAPMVNTVDTLYVEAEKLADKMLGYVNEK